MAAEYQIFYASESIEEPFEIENGSSFVFVIENVGDETGTNIGFYIKTPSSLGDVDYPSLDSPALNYEDIISQGNNGYGLTITQGLSTTRIMSGTGDTFLTKIPLTIGSGDNLNQLEPGSSIEVTLEFNLDPTEVSKNLYIDFMVE